MFMWDVRLVLEILNSGHCHQLTFRFDSSLSRNSNGELKLNHNLHQMKDKIDSATANIFHYNQVYWGNFEQWSNLLVIIVSSLVKWLLPVESVWRDENMICAPVGLSRHVLVSLAASSGMITKESYPRVINQRWDLFSAV